jgi:hypothetical protein
MTHTRTAPFPMDPDMTPPTTVTMLVVTRDCCLSGNCDTCGPHGRMPTLFGTPARVEQWRGVDPVMAAAMMKAWRPFKTTLTEDAV